MNLLLFISTSKQWGHNSIVHTSLHASLVWLSTFLPAVAVRYLKTLSEETITKLVVARFTVWKLETAGGRTATILTPRGELDHLKWKARHLQNFSDDWIKQLI